MITSSMNQVFTRRGRMIAAALMLAALPAASRAADPGPALVEARWVEDFENGTISGWSSYPAFEDTAYDFTIVPGKFRPADTLQGNLGSGEYFYPVDLAPPEGSAPNSTYLMRSTKPNSTVPQRIGMMYKTRLHAGEDSTISLDYWLSHTPSPVSVEVQLAGGDGVRYIAAVDGVELEEWRKVSLPIGEFEHDGRGMPAGTPIDAIAVVASFERGVPHAWQFFAIDNVTLDCRRQAGFDFLSPRGEAFKNWGMQFSREWAHPGEPVELAVNADVELRAVRARVEDYDGHVIIDEFALTRDGERWRAPQPLAFTAEQRHGPLAVVVEGETAEGLQARSALRLWLVEPIAAGEHPRLFVAEGELETLRARAASGEGKKIADAIRGRAAGYRRNAVPENPPIKLWHEDYILPDLPAFNTWYAILRDPAAGAIYNAWVYALDGDAEAGEWARDALVKMAGWEQWNHPWFVAQGRFSYYPLGLAAMNAGIAYDLVHELLTPEERAKVREGIVRNGVVPTWQEYFRDNRIPNNTSNWISHSAGGAMLALLAFHGDPPAGAGDGDAVLMLTTLAEKSFELARRTMRADGGYGEDYSYQDFTMETAQVTLAALDRALGVEGMARSLNYHLAHLYPLYMSFRGGHEMLTMGDSHEHLIPTTNWVWFARESGDPLMQYFHDLSRGDDWPDLLWSEDGLTTQSPAQAKLPPSRAFPLKGNVVFRSGWDEDAVVMVYRAGANYNHTHNDMGSFRIAAFGEFLADEAGYSSYYADPYFWSYFTQAGGHNVILVDGQVESQEVGDFGNEVSAFNTHARVERTLLGGPLQFLSSEMGMLYRGKLDGWNRTVHFIEPGYFVIHDGVRSSGGEHTYQWQLYPPSKEKLEVGQGREAVIRNGKAQLRVDVVLPEGAELTVKDRPIPVSVLAAAMSTTPSARANLQVTHAEPVEDQEFLVVLSPARGGETVGAGVERLRGDGWEGVQVTRGGVVDSVYYAGDSAISGEVASDGPSVAVRLESGRLVAALFEHATRGEIGGEEIFRSDRPVSIAMETSGGERIWRIHAAEPAEVRVGDRTINAPAGESTHE